MLYNPTWNKKPSIAGLIAWLETQDQTQTYNWPKVGGCLICKYYDALGINDWSSDNRPYYYQTFGDSDGAGELYHAVCKTEPWTYGAALERARALSV